ncbi:MAG: MFS transporter [Anaerolineae bacterium]
MELSTNRADAPALTGEQRRLASGLWLTYALYYIGRVNLSPALVPMAAALGLSRAEVGVIGSALFWSYGVGHLVNGQLGNRYRPRVIVGVGLAVTAVVNLLFGFQTALLAMTALWAINGFAQSTGWSPILRILSDRLGVEASKRLSVFFSMSYAVGAAVSLALAGWLVTQWGWSSAFLVPGIILAIGCGLWWLSRADAPPPALKQPGMLRGMGRDARRLWPVLAGSAFMGFVYSGSQLWMPALLTDTGLIPEAWAGSLSGLMALLSAAGMLLAGFMLRRSGHAMGIMRGFLVALAVGAGVAAMTTGLAQIAGVTLMMFTLGAVLALLMTSLPLAYAGPGRISSVSGIVSAAQYVGGGLAGVLVGVAIDGIGWGGVLALWAGCALITLALSTLVEQQARRSELVGGPETSG